MDIVHKQLIFPSSKIVACSEKLTYEDPKDISNPSSDLIPNMQTEPQRP